MQTITNLPTYVFAAVNPGCAANVVEELKRNNQIDLIRLVTIPKQEWGPTLPLFHPFSKA